MAIPLHTTMAATFAPSTFPLFASNRSFNSRPVNSIRSRARSTNSSHRTSPTKTSIPGRSPKESPTRAHPHPSPSDSGRLRDRLKLDEIGLEIWSIALPAALALCADPIASLIDTAFVGHIGAVELAAVGVSASAFNLVSKLFNVPLLNVTTSFVAEEQAQVSKGNEDEIRGKKYMPSISTSLLLAAGVGIAETLALYFFSDSLINMMGISVDSPMRGPAEDFLTLRALGAPAIVISLAAQGAFRGFKDTKTPLYAIGAGTLLNAILDPIFIFLLGFGVEGAAVATVISEYLIAFILLWELNGKVLLVSPNIDGGRVVQYLNSGGLLIGRTIAVLLTMTLATSMAAREGPIPMAGHEICMQVWLAVSLLNDALALAGQALLASGYSQGNYGQARQVIHRTLEIGLGTGIALGAILFLGFRSFARLFSTDSQVLEIAWSGVLFNALPNGPARVVMGVVFIKSTMNPQPRTFVAGSQPMNAIAFVVDGLYYGVSDFGYAAYSMVVVSALSSAFILAAAPVYGLPGVWTGLFLFMTLRVVAAGWRLGTKTGPWKILSANVEQQSE